MLHCSNNCVLLVNLHKYFEWGHSQCIFSISFDIKKLFTSINQWKGLVPWLFFVSLLESQVSLIYRHLERIYWSQFWDWQQLGFGGSDYDMNYSLQTLLGSEMSETWTWMKKLQQHLSVVPLMLLDYCWDWPAGVRVMLQQVLHPPDGKRGPRTTVLWRRYTVLLCDATAGWPW